MLPLLRRVEARNAPPRLRVFEVADLIPDHFPVVLRHPEYAGNDRRVGIRIFHFRGLLRLHTRYGPLDCSAAQGCLCREAPVPASYPASRSPASRSIGNYLGETLPH